MRKSLRNWFFLDDELADGIPDRAALGFVNTEFKTAGDPGEHGLQ
jgi:hypothetical protein